MDRRALIAALALGIAGCASTTGVMPLGGNELMLERQGSSGFSDVTKLQANTIAEARSHCAAMGQGLVVVDATHNEGPFVFGKFPRATVRFRCEKPA